MALITDYVAFKMRERLTLESVFYEMKGYFEIPFSFTDCRFLYKHKYGTGYVNLKDLLKEWVYEKSGEVSDGSYENSSRRGEVPSQSTSAGDAGSNQGSRATQQSNDDDQVHTNCDDFCSALANLNQTLTEENLAALQKIQKLAAKKGDLTEDQILVGLGVHLIKKLTGRALTNWKKRGIECPCGCKETLEFSRNMYIGSEETLHGELDLLSQGGVGVIAKGTLEVEEEPTMGEEGEMEADGDTRPNLKRRNSEGQRVNVECKKDVSIDESAAIAQAITFGWTEFNTHTHLSPFIPSLYIDSKQFGVLVYNPQDDSLVISEKSVLFIYEDMANENKYSGIFLLWIILHHRLFFRKDIDFDDDVACGFIKQVDVDAYKRLNNYSQRIMYTHSGFKWRPGFCIEAKRRERKRKRLESE